MKDFKMKVNEFLAKSYFLISQFMVLTKLTSRLHKMGKRKIHLEDNDTKKSKHDDLTKDEAKDFVPKASTSGQKIHKTLKNSDRLKSVKF